MSKVICDICGTEYPEFDDFCPNCGSSQDVSAEMDMELEDDEDELEYKRASEWAFEHFTHIPNVGETFTYENITVMVARMKLNRIQQLLLTVEAKQEQGGGEE